MGLRWDQDPERDILSGVEPELGNGQNWPETGRMQTGREHCLERQWPAQGHTTGVWVSFLEATRQET